MSTIKHITSLSDHSEILANAKDKLVIIDFHATWCGPCHAIAPKYEALSKEYTPKGAIFCKCDVDAVSEVARKYSIAAMPSFVFVKNSAKVDLVRGANPSLLESTIKKYVGGSSSAGSAAFSGKGHKLGSDNSTSAATEPDNAPSIVKLFSNMDPNLKLLLGFVGGYLAYVFFWSK